MSDVTDRLWFAIENYATTDPAAESNVQEAVDALVAEARAEGAAEVRARIEAMIPGERRPFYDDFGDHVDDCVLLEPLRAVLDRDQEEDDHA